ncbi:MAG: hypothetical protein JXB24_05080 [Bacteroidales bacterium]|nr:hypothetical protein [Bacteroidales bacterium]
MKRIKDLIPCITIFLCASMGFSQDLMEIIEETDSLPAKQFVYSTFASSRLASGHTVESPGKQELVLIISHRFWRLDDGIYDMFGLDNATIRIGLDYGITDRLSAGFGRSTYNKTFDGYLKYRIIHQATGEKGMPFSLTYLTSASVNSLRWDEERKQYLDFVHRVSYVHQVLMATKLNRIFSLQFMPGFVHKNLVEKKTDPNDMFLLGLGGKIRIAKILSLNIEYYYFANRPDNERFMHPLAIGFDIETGGHVFQLLFSNSQPWFESGFFTETNGQWRNGDIYFGFHIQRTFSLGSKPDWGKL